MAHLSGLPLCSATSLWPVRVHAGTLASRSSKSNAKRGPNIQVWYLASNWPTSRHRSVGGWAVWVQSCFCVRLCSCPIVHTVCAHGHV